MGGKPAPSIIGELHNRSGAVRVDDLTIARNPSHNVQVTVLVKVAQAEDSAGGNIYLFEDRLGELVVSIVAVEIDEAIAVGSSDDIDIVVPIDIAGNRTAKTVLAFGDQVAGESTGTVILVPPQFVRTCRDDVLDSVEVYVDELERTTLAVVSNLVSTKDPLAVILVPAEFLVIERDGDQVSIAILVYIGRDDVVCTYSLAENDVSREHQVAVVGVPGNGIVVPGGRDNIQVTITIKISDCHGPHIVRQGRYHVRGKTVSAKVFMPVDNAFVLMPANRIVSSA